MSETIMPTAAKTPSAEEIGRLAEQALVDVAAGLAYAGKIPFVNTFAFLLATRAAVVSLVCCALSKIGEAPRRPTSAWVTSNVPPTIGS